MNVRSLKLAGAAAGLLLLAGAAPQAFAQIDVITGIGASFLNGPFHIQSGVASPSTTAFTFNSSMILNSIGFYTNGESYTSLAYSINGTNQSFSTSALILRDGVAWLDLSSPLTMQKNDVVRISTLGSYDAGAEGYLTRVTDYDTVNSSANVSFDYSALGANYALTTNGNLRVSNPSSNVAPEPGSIALLLTGGGALAGIALRRRRNAD
ncbi:MAG: PEP-CTERM sorting domain-containing protein [Armatimonadaceae bacterium]